ncbi:hypothetical protein [Endozoicomonas sp. ALC066]|uniref:hypothetical protein n=1 Tax=Endozoicomonas sp. ALC066 TaxID=3403078 RepID=UPI003BB5BF40
MAGKKNGTGQELGKWFEGEIQKSLDHLQRKHKSTYQRLYDTTSAAGFMPKMPGDFICVYRGIPFLLEVKASSKYQSLSDGGAMRSLIKDHQIAAQRVWHRAGAAGGFIFLGADRKSVEFWEGVRVAEVYTKPRAKLTGKPNHKCQISQLGEGFKEFLHTLWRHYGDRVAAGIEEDEP